MTQIDTTVGVTSIPVQQTKASKLPLISIFGSGVVWGLCWWPLKFFADAGLTGILISITAYALVGLIAVPVIWRQYPSWRDETGLLMLIGLFFGVANIAFTSALMLGQVVRVMLLFYLLPAWGAMGGTLFLGERLGPRRCLSIALSLLGVFIIMGGSNVWSQALTTADLLALLSGFCYSAAGVVNKKAVRIPMASRSFIPFIFCALIGWLAHSVWQTEIPTVAPFTWVLLILFAFVWLLGGTLLTTYGVAHLEASRASVLQVMELLVAVVSALLIGGEVLEAKEWIGGSMVVVAAFMESTTSDTAPA